MSNFINNDVIDIFARTIGGLREDIGRNVTIVGKPIESDCPNCGRLGAKKTSNGKYEPTTPYPSGPIGPNAIVGPVNFVAAGSIICPVCNGAGIINTENNYSVLCLISPLNKKDAEMTPLGKDYRIAYELIASYDNIELFRLADRVIIDGSICHVVAVIPTGIGVLSQVSVYAGSK